MAHPNVRLSLSLPEYPPITLHICFSSPYYVFLGCSRSRSTTRAFKAFEIESGNTAGSGHTTPAHSPSLLANVTSPRLATTTRTAPDMPELHLGPAALDDTPSSSSHTSLVRTGSNGSGSGSVKERERGGFAFPLSSFHYQRRARRVPFLEKAEHGAFRTWIYGFTVRAVSS